MKKDLALLVAGYPSIDTIIEVDQSPQIGKTSIIVNNNYQKTNFGGCNVNISYIASKMGLSCAPMMRVGSDFKSSGFESFLKEAELNFDGIDISEDDTTSSSSLIMTETGEHITLFYPGAMADAKLTKSKIDLFRRAQYGIVTVGNPEYNLEFARNCFENRVPLVFGMKTDTSAFPKEIISEIVMGCELLFMNEQEKDFINDTLLLSDITELFQNKCTKVIVVTNGSKGSTIYAHEDNQITSHVVGIAQANKVVDTTGVGDAYIAGFMYSYLNGKPLLKCGRMGAIVSSFIVEEIGCLSNVPSNAELLNRYKTIFGEEF